MGHNTEILEDKNISAYGKLVYFTLSKYTDKGGACWPSLKTIAEMSGLSVRTVQKSIIELINTGWVCRERRKTECGDFDSNLYSLPKLGVWHDVPNLAHDMPNGMAPQTPGVRHDVPTNLSILTCPINYNISSSKDEKIDYQAIVNEYHTICYKMPKIKILDDKRKKLIKDRFKTYGRESFCIVFKNAANTPWLNGENKNNWKASFNWLLKPDKFLELYEAAPAATKKEYGGEELPIA